MSDMIVKLYDLPDEWSFMSNQSNAGVTIRKPIGTEKHLLVDWVRGQFGDAWASETDMAFAHWPMSCWLAIRDYLPIGFACYDATALGFFGPIGVAESERGKGIGKALLLACLLDMKLKGYGYAIIGFTEEYDFYKKVVNAVIIPDSFPGIWKTWLVQP
jgi:GNAT superfamily N-acetyltransferase